MRALHAVGVAGALLAGCGTVSTFDGPEPPDGELAILEGYWRYYVFAIRIVEIRSVDGTGIGAATTVKLPPGRHRIGLRVGTILGEAGLTSDCTFEAHFEKGHRYRIRSFDDATGEADIGLEVQTLRAGVATSGPIPCRRP